MAVTAPSGGQRPSLRPTNPALFSVGVGAAAAWVMYRWYSPPKPGQRGLPFPYEDAELDVQTGTRKSSGPTKKP
ncbi:hypothetical protein BDV29DRAFT_173018 [Aspergillus leporis]|uniref:Uncharacterized protein n=1 Tax=Aspergillus leporis TaxID=41062 RepID=A0A5N5X1V0_9EURO|nr:hypothetical protein BDV29DRAFT_173018 [Aspergillus leporis]